MLKASLQNKTFEKNLSGAVMILSALLLFYTGWKAVVISFTHDESRSFNLFVPQNFMDIISLKKPDANNHLLNTLFMKYSSMFFGNSEFALRWHSVASHLIYILFTWLIVSRTSSALIAFSGFVLLNVNPFLLDYFSLARGYAMALAFISVSVYFIIRYVESKRMKHVVFSLVFASLAALSGFSFLILYPAVVLVINLFWCSENKNFSASGLMKMNRVVILVSLILGIICYEPVRRLIKFECLYFGGETGFFHDTVVSVINAVIQGQPYYNPAALALKIFIVASFLTMFVAALSEFYFKKMSALQEKFVIAFLLLAFAFVISEMQHFILGTRFLFHRTAIFFVPLFCLAFIFFISDFYAGEKLRVPGRLALVIVASAFFIHTIFCLNVSSISAWRFDSETKQMLGELERLSQREKPVPVRLGISWFFEPTVNFYRTTKKYSWLPKATRVDFRKAEYDYYYLSAEDFGFADSTNRHVIRNYAVSGNYLVK